MKSDYFKLVMASLVLVFLVYPASSNFLMDEDFHPTGKGQTISPPPMYNGKVNQLEDMSDQLQPGMNTTNYGMSDPSADPDSSLNGSTNVGSEDDAKWHDSMGGVDRADQWAITLYLNWSINNRGEPRRPGATYYHKDYAGLKRSEPSDDSVSKTVKDFGNSFTAIADEKMVGQSGTSVAEGDGVWIDPDLIKKWSNEGKIKGSWQQHIYGNYDIDITGPDSGLGLNTGDNAGTNFLDPGRYWIIYGDIYFEGEKDNNDSDMDGSVDEGWGDPSTVGESTPMLEPPLCGDDTREFLMEELGEIENSDIYDGDYACADSRSVCVDTSASGGKIFDEGDYRDTDEPFEQKGRLKEDKEVCVEYTDMVYAKTKWFDQDFGDVDNDGSQDTCRQNTLYGKDGVRWFDSSYVTDYPYAVQEGVDDDWSDYLTRLWREGNYTGNLTSYPNRDHYDYDSDGVDDFDPDMDGEEEVTPVSSGNIIDPVPNRTVATMGFCGGDDKGEFLTVQRCKTDLCQTDTSVIGMSKVPGSCILEGDNYPVPPENDKRLVYQPGQNVTFDLGPDKRTVACFDGMWFEEWPIVFEQDTIDVGLSETRKVGFRLINAESQQRQFKVKLENTGVSQFVSFTHTNGDSFTATVPPRSSKSYEVEIYGGDKNIDAGDLRVQADVVNSRISGEDSVTVDILSSGATGTTGGQEERQTRNVPGIGLVHLLFLLGSALAVFFTQS